jgi:pyrimidine-nucleoside phosphorylase
MWNALEFIERKRDGSANSTEELSRFAAAVRDDAIPDYQTSAWLMAVFFNGLDREELIAFTDALASSGDRVNLSGSSSLGRPGITVDKHSTGGVGDKTTLAVAPLVAACGLKVAKLSGRGLGLTGGTVDKLESIPGMSMRLSADQFIRQADEIGIAISGHSLALAPAEGKFYALRDVTGTVPSLSLIASSIVSKKIAGGADAFVFDVKCGSGAFMANVDEAMKLAEVLVDLSGALGRRSVCLVTDMDQPLGEWVGNSVEVLEAIEVLSGGGPGDTRDLCLALAAEMLILGGAAENLESAREETERALDCGAGLRKFEAMVGAQGGDASVCSNPEKVLPKAAKKSVITSDRSGVVEKMDARAIGLAVRALGGGRMRKGDSIDPSAGLRILKKIGDRVSVGEPLIEIHYNEDGRIASALPYLERAWAVGDPGAVPKRGLVLDRVPPNAARGATT